MLPPTIRGAKTGLTLEVPHVVSGFTTAGNEQGKITTWHQYLEAGF